MYLHEIKLRPKAHKKPKVLGRGFGSGRGKTATKGTKGQNVRKSGSTRLGFEGGQTVLYRRLPKIGFNNKVFANNYNVITLEMVNRWQQKEITPAFLKTAGLLQNTNWPIKVIGNTALQKPVVIHAHAFSQGALTAISAGKGKAIVLEKNNLPAKA